jgi:hypothetical protein
MAWLTRRRNSKKLQVRGTGGRYAKTPSLGCEVCVHCQALIMKTMSAGPFPMPEWPKTCHHCGKD